MRHSNSKYLMVFGLSAALVSGCAGRGKCRIARSVLTSRISTCQNSGCLPGKSRLVASQVQLEEADDCQCRQPLSALASGQPANRIPTAAKTAAATTMTDPISMLVEPTMGSTDGSYSKDTDPYFQIMDRQAESLQEPDDADASTLYSESGTDAPILSTENSSRTYYHGDTHRSGNVVISENQYATSLKTNLKASVLHLEPAAEIELAPTADSEIETLDSWENEIDIDFSPPAFDSSIDRKTPSPAPEPISQSAPVARPAIQKVIATIEIVDESADDSTAEPIIAAMSKSVEAVLSVPRYLKSLKIQQMSRDQAMEKRVETQIREPMPEISDLQPPTQIANNPLVLRADPTARGDFLTNVTRRAQYREIENRLNASSPQLSSWIIEPVNFRPLPSWSSPYEPNVKFARDTAELSTATTNHLTSSASSAGPSNSTTRLVTENRSFSTEQPLPLRVSNTNRNWATLPKTDAVTRAQLTFQSQKRQRQLQFQVQQESQYGQQQIQTQQAGTAYNPSPYSENSASLVVGPNIQRNANSNEFGDQELTGNIQPESVSSERLRLRATPNQSNPWNPPLVNIATDSNHAARIVGSQIQSDNAQRLDTLNQQLHFGNQLNCNQALPQDTQTDDSIRRLTVRPNDSDDPAVTIDR